MRYLTQALICLTVLIFFTSTTVYCKEKPTTYNIQVALKSAEFYTGRIDGQRSPMLTKAIRDFQTTYGLTSDGIVGNITWSYLEPFARETSQSPAEENAIERAPPQSRKKPKDARQHYISSSNNPFTYEIGGMCQWATFETGGDVEGELKIWRSSIIVGYFLNTGLEIAGSITYLYIGDESSGVGGWAFPVSAVLTMPFTNEIDLALAPFLGYIALDAEGHDMDGIALGFLAGIRYHLRKNWRLNVGIQYLYTSVDGDGLEVELGVWMPDIGLSYLF